MPTKKTTKVDEDLKDAAKALLNKEDQEQEEKKARTRAMDAERKRKSRERDRLKAVERQVTKAINRLPLSAHASRELNWIKAHPAMGRKARMSTDGPVVIEADDILKAPHGKAPSQSAVNQLQFWANKPDEFFKQMMQEDKKRLKEVSDDFAGDQEIPDEVQRIDELLASLDEALPIDD